MQRPQLVQTQINADANSSRDTSIWGRIEQGLNALTGGASRSILLSPQFTAALNAIDGFFAGVADSLTAGLSTKLRAAMWGETATQNHTGGWFMLGQGVGAVLSIPLMAANPCSLGIIGNIGLRLINGAQLIGNGISAVENIMAGNYLSAGLNILGMVGNLSQLAKACFTGDIQVKTRRGWVRWDALTERDEVLSCDKHDSRGQLAYKPIELLLRTEAPIWHVHVKGQVIRTTSEHPFYVWCKGWVAARDLQSGDHLRSDDGQFVVVEEAIDTGVVEPVYNCSVTEYHTYFVGEETWGVSVWAHNKCGGVTTGDLGETQARDFFVKRGNTYLGQIQNNSGHGVDLVFKNKAGTLFFVEVSVIVCKGRARGRPGDTQDNGRGALRAARARGQRPNQQPAPGGSKGVLPLAGKGSPNSRKPAGAP